MNNELSDNHCLTNIEALRSGRFWLGGRVFIVLSALLLSCCFPGGNLAGLFLLWLTVFTADGGWRASLRELGFNSAGIRWGVVISGTLLLFIASSLAQWLTRTLLEGCGLEYKTQFLADYFLSLTGWRAIWLTVSIVIIAPLFEEVLFRHIIFGWVLRFFSLPVAMVVVSLLFGWLHSLYQLPGLLVLGLGWQYVYIRSGNIADTVLMHGLNNGLTLLLLYIGKVMA